MVDEPRSLPKAAKIALITSVILNLFLVALLGGHLLRGELRARAPVGSLARALANAGANLKEPDAAVFKSIMNTNASHYTEASQHLVEARQELRRQIAADHFDPDAARQAYAAWQKSLNVFIDDFGDALIDALNHISPDGRRQILSERRKGLTGAVAPQGPPTP